MTKRIEWSPRFPLRTALNGVLVALVGGMLALPPPAAAAFSSGSTGADGALNLGNLPPGTTLDFDPAGFNPALDQDGDGIFHFTTVNIPAGVTLRLRSRILGARPIYWAATGDVTIAGTLDLTGSDGHAAAVGVSRTPSDPGPGGYAGGVGARNLILGTAGSGPQGGVQYGCVASGGAHSNYGNVFVNPPTGGSGGGGGGQAMCQAQQNGGGGGAGGGAIAIASSTRVTVSGAILAVGGNGGPTGGQNCSQLPASYAGAGGGGGSIRISAPVFAGNGQLSVVGGSGVAYGGTYCTGSGAGTAGRIRIETNDYQFAGPAFGSTSSLRQVGLPDSLVVLPASNPFPIVRIVSIGGVSVPPSPTATFNPADVTINANGAVTVSLAASNVPLGTQLDVLLGNESTGNSTVKSTALAGSLASSTATASVTVPSGYSYLQVKAKWTP